MAGQRRVPLLVPVSARRRPPPTSPTMANSSPSLTILIWSQIWSRRSRGA